MLAAVSTYLVAVVARVDGTACLVAVAACMVSCLFVRQRTRRRHVAHLPFARRLVRALPLLVAIGTVAVVGLAKSPALVALGLGMVSVALGAAVGFFARGLSGTYGPMIRAAVVGPRSFANVLAEELDGGVGTNLQLVGHIDAVDVGGSSLAELVTEHQIDLLLIGQSGDEAAVFEEIGRTWAGVDVAVEDLANFYESSLGRAPLAAIDGIWLRDVLRPTTPTDELVRRIRDVLVAGMLLAAAAPVLVALAVLIRRDGGPVLFRQARVGRGGDEFEILKLRSMRHTDTTEVRWSSADDDRVTGIGRFMRRTHLDEIPQLINILRGDMSLVGPRPEQSAIVSGLAEEIPFYSWRHRVRPGLTGWAQVIAGYCGTDRGSAIKTCYDLYYLKYRSLSLDTLILFETARALVADRQWQLPDVSDTFVPDRATATSTAGATATPGGDGADRRGPHGAPARNDLVAAKR
ncbi:MAG: sugar transferase [Acidimicrobiales bacterium]